MPEYIWVAGVALLATLLIFAVKGRVQPSIERWWHRRG